MHTYSTVEDTASLWKALLPVCKPPFYSLMIDYVFISSSLNLKLKKREKNEHAFSSGQKSNEKGEPRGKQGGNRLGGGIVCNTKVQQ